MLIFLDTEFTDFIDCELISIGMVAEDGRQELYLEVQDFDRSKCNAFVQSAVWTQLSRIEEAIVLKVEVQARLRDWFATLPRSVTIACDSQHDRDLLADALDGEWPDEGTSLAPCPVRRTSPSGRLAGLDGSAPV